MLRNTPLGASSFAACPGLGAQVVPMRTTGLHLAVGSLFLLQRACPGCSGPGWHLSLQCVGLWVVPLRPQGRRNGNSSARPTIVNWKPCSNCVFRSFF